jgi:putative hemolysin
MARGFDSKDVEFQQAEALRQPRGARPRSPQEHEAFDRRRTLELSLARAQAELAAARSAVHRQMLEHAIASLRERLDRGTSK